MEAFPLPLIRLGQFAFIEIAIAVADVVLDADDLEALDALTPATGNRYREIGMSMVRL